MEALENVLVPIVVEKTIESKRMGLYAVPAPKRAPADQFPPVSKWIEDLKSKSKAAPLAKTMAAYLDGRCTMMKTRAARKKWTDTKRKTQAELLKQLQEERGKFGANGGHVPKRVAVRGDVTVTMTLAQDKVRPSVSKNKIKGIVQEAMETVMTHRSVVQACADAGLIDAPPAEQLKYILKHPKWVQAILSQAEKRYVAFRSSVVRMRDTVRIKTVTRKSRQTARSRSRSVER
jgi:hypothetical protein